MAKSLFASLPQQIPKKAVPFQKLNDVFVKEEGNNSHKNMNIQGQFHEFHKAYNTHSHHHLNIGPHMFRNRIHTFKIKKKISSLVENTFCPSVLCLI